MALDGQCNKKVESILCVAGCCDIPVPVPYADCALSSATNILV